MCALSIGKLSCDGRIMSDTESASAYEILKIIDFRDGILIFTELVTPQTTQLRVLDITQQYISTLCYSNQSVEWLCETHLPLKSVSTLVCSSFPAGVVHLCLSTIPHNNM